ncbi:paraquat-inducible protein A [Ningiella sp. W23]|uniref:paraquat-inducible protein A n=1 Tax=Ningiella sp. W23 TaxID=3023715 RepID=UPI003756B2A4
MTRRRCSLVHDSATHLQGNRPSQSHKRASDLGLASCTRCLSLTDVRKHSHCTLCNKRLYLRRPNSVQKTLALLLTAMLFYIPANIYPIMKTDVLGSEEGSTIIGGVLLFLDHGSYFVAFVIFTASVIIPVAKMLIIAWLCYCVKVRETMKYKELTDLYLLTEFIGKWSMVDVFVVAILVALVQISGIIAIHPGVAVQAFAIVVLLTMLSAQQFDVRLIWDKMATGTSATKSAKQVMND